MSSQGQSISTGQNVSPIQSVTSLITMFYISFHQLWSLSCSYSFLIPQFTHSCTTLTPSSLMNSEWMKEAVMNGRLHRPSDTYLRHHEQVVDHISGRWDGRLQLTGFFNRKAASFYGKPCLWDLGHRFPLRLMCAFQSVDQGPGSLNFL